MVARIATMSSRVPTIATLVCDRAQVRLWRVAISGSRIVRRTEVQKITCRIALARMLAKTPTKIAKTVLL